jgi:hypothetical protein
LDKNQQSFSNPEAAEAERKFLAKDKHLLEKRRYQRVLKEI